MTVRLGDSRGGLRAARQARELREAFHTHVRVLRSQIPIERLTARQARRLANAMPGRTRSNWRRYEETLTSRLTSAGKEGSDFVGRQIEAARKAAWGDTREHVLEWAGLFAARRVTAMTSTMRRALRTEITSFLEEQTLGVVGGPRELARRLRQVVGLTPRQVRSVQLLRERLIAQGESLGAVRRAVLREIERKERIRAIRIARTEMITAFNRGTFQQILQEQAEGGFGDEPAVKVWQTAEDERVDCKICKKLNGQKRPLRKAFEGGFMTPTAHPNCRCTLLYEVEEVLSLAA